MAKVGKSVRFVDEDVDDYNSEENAEAEEGDNDEDMEGNSDDNYETDEEANEEEEETQVDEENGTAGHSSSYAHPSRQYDLENMSTLEKKQKRLREQIAAFEEINLSEKTWQMKGEAVADKRPANSLLEEHLKVDRPIRPPPVITKEISAKIEDIIKQRIRVSYWCYFYRCDEIQSKNWFKDKAYDDVERKEKPAEVGVKKYRNELVLDQKKSALSLAQVYEAEYQQKLASATAPQATVSLFSPTEKAKLRPEHEVIMRGLKELFYKLDNLSNFHFNPHPYSDADVVVSKNLPSVMMEEVAPVAISDATMLAPKEVKSLAPPTAIEEPTVAAKERKRKRKAKKFGEKLEKQKAADGISSAKKKLKGKQKGGSTSTEFFASLQAQVQKDIDKKKNSKVEKTKGDRKAKSGAAFKL